MFYSNDSKYFHVFPEIVRMLHITLLRTAKIMGRPRVLEIFKENSV